jgi:hypothetical protein
LSPIDKNCSSRHPPSLNPNAAAGYYLDGHVVNMRAPRKMGEGHCTADRPSGLLGMSPARRTRQVSHRSIGRLRHPATPPAMLAVRAPVRCPHIPRGRRPGRLRAAREVAKLQPTSPSRCRSSRPASLASEYRTSAHPATPPAVLAVRALARRPHIPRGRRPGRLRAAREVAKLQPTSPSRCRSSLLAFASEVITGFGNRRGMREEGRGRCSAGGDFPTGVDA